MSIWQSLPSLERRLLRATLVLAVLVVLGELFVFALGVVPLVGLLALPLVPLPSVLLYLGPAVLLHVLLLAPWALRGIWPPAIWRWALLALLLAASLTGGIAVSAALNGRVSPLPAVAAPPKPVVLQPVSRVALIDISGHFGRVEPRCGSFCTALLLSGRAREVDVAHVYASSLDVALSVPGARFRLASRGASCRQDEALWRDLFAGRPFSQVQESGGFDSAFMRRFESCIRGEPASVGAAELRFVRTMPRVEPRRWLGIDVSTPVARLAAEWRVHASDGRLLAQWRVAWHQRYYEPMLLNPMSGNAASGRGPTHWAREDVATADSPMMAPMKWWDLIADASGLYALALVEAEKLP